MFDLASLWWLLLPLGVVLGWVSAHRLDGPPSSDTDGDDRHGPGMSRTHPEEARTGTAPSTTDNPSPHEMQVILGAVFRQRGEVSRAIAMHERLLDDPSMDSAGRDDARFELAQDYMKAGLMDRAEVLLGKLIERGVRTIEAMESLVSIFEQARDWEQAIEMTRRLRGTKAQDLGSLLAHYHCELAERALAAGDESEAVDLAQRALDADRGSVRASLLLGELAEKHADPMSALRAYRRVPRQNPRFLSEVIPRLSRCCDALSRPDMFSEFIDEASQRFPENPGVALAAARLMEARGEDAGTFLAERLARHPHWPGLLALLDIRAEAEPTVAGLEALRDALRERVKSRPAYRCAACGLMHRLLFWQCPGCRHWDSVLPDEDHLY